MNSNIQDILDELYSLSPELKSQEDTIVHVIEKMQKNTPRIKMNEAFRTELREKVLAQFVRHRDEGSDPVTKNNSFRERPWIASQARKDGNSWLSQSWLLGFGTAIALGCVGFLIAMPILGLFQRQTQLSSPMGGSYGMQKTVDSSRAAEPAAMMVQDMTPSIDPYIEYVYTGSFDGLLRDMPSYKQLYPQNPRQINGFALYDFGGPINDMCGVYTDQSMLETLYLAQISHDNLMSKIRRAENPFLIPSDGQPSIQVPLYSPRVAYQRVPVTDPQTGNGTNYYVPALVFQVGSHTAPYAIPEEVVVPFVEIPQK